MAIGLVGLLVVTAVVYGVGVASAKYKLSDVGAWLGATSKGMLVHVNGPAAKVDGKAQLPARHRTANIKIIQDGNTVLLVDQTTGVVSRIDPSQLKVTQSQQFGGVRLQVLANAGKAYTVDPVKGVVQEIDPVKLAPVGNPATVAPPLEEAGVDVRGTLWVPSPQTGQVVPFSGGALHGPVRVGTGGDRLSLAIAAGEPVVVNATAGTATMVGPDGTGRLTANLPSTMRQATRTGAETLVPPRTEAKTVPLLVQSTGSLVLLDTGTAQFRSVKLRLPRHRYQAPQILGSRVYIPDESAGALRVYNTATGGMEGTIAVAGRNADLEVFVKDGMLWAHDPQRSGAVVLDGRGPARAFGKYEDQVAGGNNRRSLPQGQGGQQPSTTPNNPPQPPPPPNRTPPPPGAPPEPPTGLVVTPGAGTMRIGFQPALGGSPTGYVLKDVPAGLTAAPAALAPNAGEYAFTVSGGDCAQEYRFRVAVQYKDAQGRAGERVSGYTDPVRPCVAPGAPSGIQAQATAQGARLSWAAPAGAQGAAVSYKVGWTGPTSGTKNVTTTSATLGTIWINGQYTFTVSAANGAGSGDGTSTSATLTGPSRSYAIQHNGSSDAYARSAANGTSGTVYTYNDNGHTLTVLCQVKGAYYTHPTAGANFAGDLYNRVSTPSGPGYMIGYLANTPGSAGTGWRNFVGLPLWRCS
ncbi:fibronectin type III domain-containing protein [Spirillospora sp. NPDC047279]|uniref:fibronectin type III domain-containing protein n=1 Tax=Spirillospora sp. NPDC047279 TaxID=3155478 RepID=UPI0033EAA686